MDTLSLSVKLQQLPEADADALLRLLWIWNPRNPVVGNVVSFHKLRASVLVAVVWRWVRPDPVRSFARELAAAQEANSNQSREMTRKLPQK